MDQVEDEYRLPREKPGRKIAGSTDCTGSTISVLEVPLNWIKACAQLHVAEHKTLKSFVVGANKR